MQADPVMKAPFIGEQGAHFALLPEQCSVPALELTLPPLSALFPICEPSTP
jgi:hypothetical protein